ncbi:unnamed protein product, partial [Prorocentrum cordatum]
APTGTTTLLGDIAEGSQMLTVWSRAGFSVGDTISLTAADGSTETQAIESVDGEDDSNGILNLKAGLQKAYSDGAAVKKEKSAPSAEKAAEAKGDENADAKAADGGDGDGDKMRWRPSRSLLQPTGRRARAAPPSWCGQQTVSPRATR